MWTEWRVVIPRPPGMTCGRQCRGYRVPRSGLSLDQGDGLLHAPEHALLTPAEALALGGRQAARIQLPLAQDRELVRPRQLRMGHDVLGFGKEGAGMLEHRIPVEVRGCLHHELILLTQCGSRKPRSGK